MSDLDGRSLLLGLGSFQDCCNNPLYQSSELKICCALVLRQVSGRSALRLFHLYAVGTVKFNIYALLRYSRNEILNASGRFSLIDIILRGWKFDPAIDSCAILWFYPEGILPSTT